MPEIPGRPGSDYINANYIDVSNHSYVLYLNEVALCEDGFFACLRVILCLRPSLPLKVQCQTLFLTSGEWCGKKTAPSLSWLLILKRGAE